ncbi:hypothetical protein V6Z11_A12G055200 [Gossypium hirsutum]
MLSNLLLSPCFPAERLVPRPSICDQRRPSDGDSVFLLFSCSNHRSWRRGCGRATSELGVVLGVPTCVVDRC